MEKTDTLRITILTIMLAILFGVVQISPQIYGQNTSSLIIPVNTIAKISFNVNLIIIFIYAMLLAAKYTYKIKPNNQKIIEFLYDLIISIFAITVVAVLLSFGWDLLNQVINLSKIDVLFYIILLVFLYKFWIQIMRNHMVALNSIKLKWRVFMLISDWWKKTFNLTRFFRAFLFAVTIGLGVYLGIVFNKMNWLLALCVVTLILMLFAGNLLDVLYPVKVKPKNINNEKVERKK